MILFDASHIKQDTTSVNYGSNSNPGRNDVEEGELLEENPSPKKTKVVSEKPPRIYPDLWEDQDPQ